ncbi:replicative DNA helicase [Candidatus Peregrinibacteria bacterium]|jgi:replicative DNA helicase|nr:replicative DNA helicase [Candidatus Peregrinibacteria bacterium]MBT4631828.1 replicative DNA helicase [Candidatus Peregrinibacteria bacterium]MBT5517280.1 replicative DNA helicase [Candidatus Peregrinibacteria bacterium]MBT5824447.1 replicative DNA helicase [Candidatus Peregrinibacteria bacterium]
MTTDIKIPPHNLEAEKSVLGSVMIEKNAIIKIADLIEPEDFYFDTHGIIYTAMQELFAKRSPIDLLTVSTWLRDNNKIDQIGGQTYLEELCNEVLTASHVFQYALLVKQKSTLRKLVSAGSNIAAIGYKEDEDVDELVDRAEKELFNVSQAFMRNRFVPIKDVLATTYEKISELHDPETADKYKGLQTGYHALDNILIGFQPSDLVILAARPSMGKTALALNIAQNAALKGKSVGVISLEMSKEQLVERLFVGMLGVDSWKMKTGQLTQDDFMRMGQVMDQLNSCKIFIDDSAGSSVSELKAKARRLQMEHGLDMLVVDYLQLMSYGKSGTSITNRVQEISEISRSLKQLARELHIPILALSQLSRAVEQRPVKIPQLSDLRESGAIEQDADVVLMMYREDYYEEDTDRAGITDIFIRKHRHGSVGRIELLFKKEQLRFFDIDRQHQSQDFSGAPMPTMQEVAF